MRGVISIAITLAIVAGLAHTLILKKMYADHGHDILIAFGAPSGETIQMHTAVKYRMVMRDPVQQDDQGRFLWNEWIEAHFRLRDESGKRLGLRRSGSSSLVEKSRAAAAADFFLITSLTKGQNYTMDFIPEMDKPQVYRHTFSAPHDAKDVWHEKFLPVTDAS